MSLSYLALGSNLGNKEENLHRAINELSLSTGRVLAVSAFIETKPIGFNSDNYFLNAVLLIDTALNPLALLESTQQIEREMGRLKKSNGTYSDRLIDIDILLYDNLLID